MERRRSRHALLLLSAVMASLVAGSTAGIYHIVGAGKGWRMPPNRTYYEDWARTRQISIGDKLSKAAHPSFLIDHHDARHPSFFLHSATCLPVFLYRSGVHNIVEVPTRELFDACSAINVLLVPPPPPDTDDDSSGAARLLGRAGAGLAAACLCLVSALLTMAV
jgi:hypothetical protein